MRRSAGLGFLLFLVFGAEVFLAQGCGGFKDAGQPGGASSGDSPDGGGGATEGGGGSTATDGGGGGATDGGGGGGGATDTGPQDASLKVDVVPLVTGRSRLGARATAGFGAWGGGLAVKGDQVFWVESGTSPGLYSAKTTPCTPSCVTPLATFTRPSAFQATATDLFIADITQLKRFPYAASSAAPLASGTDEIVNLATDGTNVFWTQGTKQAIEMTVPGGTTTAPIYSNGTPIAMTVAGSDVFWTGVDISGLLGAMQAIHTDGTGAREVSRFSSGFDAMRGNATFLYYAKDSPATIHRRTLATGHEDTVATDASSVADFAIDATYAYWVELGDGPDYLNGRVRRVAHDSTVAETIAVSIARPVAVAVDGKTAYVASAGTKTASYADGRLLKVTISP